MDAGLGNSFAALLDYPARDLAGTCADAISACTPVNPYAAVQVAAFAGAVADLSLVELQELYTRTFDFDADAALYVGHHLFGEDGRRGLLMSGLVDRYRRLGIDAGPELADHFAPVVRSLALDSSSEEARDLVRSALLPAVAKVVAALERRAPAYAALLTALASVLDAGEDAGYDAWTSSSSPFFLTSR